MKYLTFVAKLYIFYPVLVEKSETKRIEKMKLKSNKLMRRKCFSKSDIQATPLLRQGKRKKFELNRPNPETSQIASDELCAVIEYIEYYGWQSHRNVVSVSAMHNVNHHSHRKRVLKQRIPIWLVDAARPPATI